MFKLKLFFSGLSVVLSLGKYVKLYHSLFALFESAVDFFLGLRDSRSILCLGKASFGLNSTLIWPDKSNPRDIDLVTL